MNPRSATFSTARRTSMDPLSNSRSSEAPASISGLFTNAKRKRMHARFRRMDKDLPDTKASRNTLSPFTRLPNELVVEIILYAQDWTVSRHALPWLKLTHVCRHWRAVALGTPRLWMKFEICEDATLMAAILERSGGAKLQVTSRMNTPLVAKTTEAILRDHAHRVHRLDIYHWSPGCNLNDVRFSTLERLKVEGTADDGNNGCNEADTNFDFERDPARFPRLRVLSMRDMAFPPTSQVLASLVRLELLLLHHLPSSVDALLDILGSTKHLEALIISGCPLSTADSLEKPPRVVSLERLRLLCFSDASPNVAFLLSSLDIPACSSLQLGLIIHNQDSTPDSDAFIAALARFKSHIPSFPTLQRVSIDMSTPGKSCCDADVQDAIANLPPFRVSARSENFEGEGWCDERLPACTFGGLLSALPVTTFDLNIGASFLDIAEYRSLLRGCLDVARLSIAADYVAPFLTALGECTADAHGLGGFLCPKLKTLAMDIAVGNVWTDPSYGAVVGPALLRALRSRASCGMVLEQLTLRKSADVVWKEAEVVAELEPLVGVLKLVGAESGSESDTDT
ncbi:hypothetical protein B0H21DRAFT_489238 [Amylocystis lapponica]|nr:hypothetical protein B0H21DRAFT_489238 [Amylocystis lapponica]